MWITAVDFIPLIGALITLLILISILIRSSDIRIADYCLVLFLFICFLSLIHKFLNHTGLIIDYIHLTKVNHLLGILRPPLFFLYIYFAVSNQTRYTYFHLLHFLPFVILTVYLIPYFLLPTETKYQIYTRAISSNVGKLTSWYSLWGIVYSAGYLIWSWYIYNKARQSKIFLKSATRGWILVFLFAHATFLLGAIIMIAFQLSDTWDYLTYHFMTLFIVIGSVVLLVNAGKNMFRLEKPKPLKNTEYNSSLLNNAIHVLTSEKLYLNEKFRIKDLAERLQVPEYVLSQAINIESGFSFNDLINQLRIEEFKRKLKDPTLQHLTIEAMAMDSGFNTKASFYATFKKQMGITPGEYKLKEVKLS
jgi:AraC-like DNA-binding protein